MNRRELSYISHLQTSIKMAYKKYIKRGNKVFGPYYYKSYRSKGKVKKIYIGGKKEYKLWLKGKLKKELKK